MGQHLLIRGKEAVEWSCAKNNAHTQDCGYGKGHPQGLTHALARAVQVARAIVLTHKGGQRQGYRLHRNEHKHIQLVITGPTRHAGRPKKVDVALHKHVGKRCDGLLHAAGQPDGQNTPEHAAAQAQIVPSDAVGRVIVRKDEKHEQR